MSVMASTSSKSLPFIVLAIAFALALYEAETGREVPLETIVPVLGAIGVAGATKAAVEKVAEARKGLKPLADYTKKELEEAAKAKA